MEEMISDRHANSGSQVHSDLFSNLILASQDEAETKYKLSPDELMGKRIAKWEWDDLSERYPGDTFIFLLAGHEVRHFPYAIFMAKLTKK